MIKSAYIHIPFCKSKCRYCSFISYTQTDLKEDYLNALLKEIRHYYKGELLDTIYFGGGTPSLLTVSEFEKLLGMFNFNEKTEITAELNPETLSQEYLNGLKSTGINRISIGCQTFDDNILKLIGRRHTSKQAEAAVKFAQNAGFDNISLDFIYGLLNQTVKMFEDDLKHALSLNIAHISLYGLKIDKSCYFYTHRPQNLPDEDIQADMYLKAIEILKDFNHYEISNFGKPSRHNLNYWNNNNYYGFGAAAHGYIENTRYSNFETLEKYIQNPLNHAFETLLTKQQRLEEEIFLGLRKTSGLDLSKINKKFNIDFEKKYSNILKKYRDFFVKTDSGYALNTRGIMVSSSILSEFLD